MRPVKIGYDAQSMTGKYQTGLGVYSKGLARILERHPETVDLRLLWPKHRRPFRRTWERMAWEQYYMLMGGIREEVDLIHVPCFSVPKMGHIPKVVTAHDVILMKHPRLMSPGSRWYFSRWIPSSYRYADHIIAVSRATRDDLVNLAGIDPGKITVIYHGINPAFTRNTNPHDINRIRFKYHCPGDFFLMVGAFEPRKNIKITIDAFARIAEHSSQLKLLLVGKENDYHKQVIDKVRQMKLREKVILPGYIPDHELAVLYTVATSLVFPSVAEGFGLPLVEAMACGCPIIASNLKVFHEIGGDAVEYVPVNDAESLSEQMLKMLDDPQHRAMLTLNGLSRSLNFNWDHCAEETVKVYFRVLTKRGAHF